MFHNPRTPTSAKRKGGGFSYPFFGAALSHHNFIAFIFICRWTFHIHCHSHYLYWRLDDYQCPVQVLMSIDLLSHVLDLMIQPVNKVVYTVMPHLSRGEASFQLQHISRITKT